jgi:hypothetical protein
MAQKCTRQEEEKQTLQKFLKNQGEDFCPNLVSYSKIKEPCDVLYKGIEYQITYGNRKLLGDLRKTTSVRSKENPNVSESFCRIIGYPSLIDYAKEVLETALKDKKGKSDGKMTLLVEPAYTSYGLFPEREEFFKKYFKDNEQRLDGLWQSIFIVFPDGNIKLR